MNFKTCPECGRNLPDTPEHWVQRLKKGGVWGSTKRCRKCMNKRASERRTIREIKKLLAKVA